MQNQLAAVTGRSPNVKYSDVVRSQMPTARANYYTGLQNKQAEERLKLQGEAMKAQEKQAKTANTISATGLGYMAGGPLGAATGLIATNADTLWKKTGNMLEKAWDITTGDSHLCGAIHKVVGLSRNQIVMLGRMLRYAEENHSEDTRRYKVLGRELIERISSQIKDLKAFMSDLRDVIVSPVVSEVEIGNVESGFQIYKRECVKLFDEYAPALLEA